jgi:hypothetical protein
MAWEDWIRTDIVTGAAVKNGDIEWVTIGIKDRGAILAGQSSLGGPRGIEIRFRRSTVERHNVLKRPLAPSDRSFANNYATTTDDPHGN